MRAFFSTNSHKYKDLLEFKTFKIHIPTFLDELIKECKKKEVKFINFCFKTLEDVFDLKQELIVNCLGMGSKKLFLDDKFYGLKGHHVYFEN